MRVIGGRSRGRRLPAKLPASVRPTSDRVREAIFDILGSQGGVEGLAVIDLFCGSGALGVEALSRGAASSTFVDLNPDAVRLSFDTKVIGPLMLAKHLAPRMGPGGSFTIFSGVAAAKIAVGTLAVAITNSAADTLARSLALELAPIRVNAMSPGVIDTGAWDALGEQGKADYFANLIARNPARRIGTTDDIANGVLFAMTSTFLTGQTLHIDGGEPLT